MKIALVDSNRNHWKIGKFCRHSQLEPLGIEYIAAYVRENGYIVRIFHQDEDNEKELINKLKNFQPNIIGFSTYTYNFHYACQIAEKAKKVLPNSYIIFGGHHITADPRNFFRPPIDIGVIGEGEQVFLNLLKSIESDNNLINVKSIIFKDKRNLVVTKREKRILNLDKLPFPLRDKKILKKCKMQAAVYPSPSEQESVAQIITARGCSNNCNFCSSPHMWKNKIVYRDPELIVNEIEDLSWRFATNLFHISDLSFNSNNDYVIEFCEKLINRNLDIYWTATGNIDNINEKVIKIMYKAKCRRFGFGLESLSSKTLEIIKPKNILGFDRINEILLMVRKNGIFTRGFFMIGYPWETVKDLEEMTIKIPKLYLDDIRITFFTPQPGTSFYKECLNKKTIKTFDFSNFDTETPILKLKYISPLELIEVRKKLFNNFYLSNYYYDRCQNQIKKFPEYKKVYYELYNNLKKRGAISA